MPTELTFRQVYNFVTGKKDDPKLIDNMDSLLNLAFACSSLFMDPGSVALQQIMPIKDEIKEISKRVLNELKPNNEDDYVARYQRMEMAYGLICFTAFFEALYCQIPELINERIKLRKSEEIRKDFWGKNFCSSGTSSSDPSYTLDEALATLKTQFPHPVETLEQQIERNEELWEKMAINFCEFIQHSVLWMEEAKDKDKEQILAWIENVPLEASKCYQAQYFELSQSYNSFAVWANLYEHKKTKLMMDSLSKQFQQQNALVKENKSEIDIGFEKMLEMVKSIPETLKTSQANEIAIALKRSYDKEMLEPVPEGVESQRDETSLCFPKICDAFIPQSFRVLLWESKLKSLEDEDTWKSFERRGDLTDYLISYLRSPFSTETPLVILGHPGSGKSLLTKVLSARLMCNEYTVVRVPLREVNADARIARQIEERIRTVTGDYIRWTKFSSAFKNNPPLVILDGYDELLQATGRVFSRFLEDIKDFQIDESTQGRPVRIIVTSRITLIDKVTVPQGATIIRLLEFDKKQRNKWISIWNRENKNYFSKARIDEFSLPRENEDGAAKILSLAGQPLLLLMLAIYDSEENKLRKSKSLDRTILYDRLLRRFVEREKNRDRDFKALETLARKKEIDKEMQRLSVVALGMYNRRKLHITSPELNEDIRFFGLEEHSVSVNSGWQLKPADLLLSSFFFIHKSKAQLKTSAPEIYEEMAAFEFLHNTFGEFLTAEFIIRQVMNEVDTLKGLNENEKLRIEYDKRLYLTDSLSKEWFASLIYRPLFTRPVVLEMMREWLGHALKRRDLSQKDFLSYLDTIIMNQIKRLLVKMELPSVIWKEAAQEGYHTPFGDHPLLGHIAIYSINLILLRITVTDKPFVFNESLISMYEDGARPWDRLTHIWRSWFSLDNLNDLTTIMIANRQENGLVTVKLQEKLKINESQDRLETFLNVSLSLGDNISSGVTGLLLFEPAKDNYLDIKDITQRLVSEKIDLEFQITIKRLLQDELYVTPSNMREFAKVIRQAFEIAISGNKREELEHISLSLQRAMRRLKIREFSTAPPNHNQFKIFLFDAISPGTAVNVAIRNPKAALILCQLAKETFDTSWNCNFLRKLVEATSYKLKMKDILESTPDVWMSWLQLVMEIKNWRFLEHDEVLLRQDFFDHFVFRTIDLHDLSRLSQRDPEAVMTWLQLAIEVGGKVFLQRIKLDFFDQMFRPDYVLKLSKRNPEVALAWLQLAHEFGREGFLRQKDPKFFDQALSLNYLLELSKQSPELALAWLRLMREIGGENVLWRINMGFFDQTLSPDYLLELSEQSPELTLAWVQMMREVGGESVLLQINTKLFDRIFLPDNILEMSERNPEIALGWIQLAKEVERENFLEQHCEKIIYQWFNRFDCLWILRNNPTAFTVPLRLARITELPYAIEIISRFLASSLNKLSSEEISLKLPLATLSDLKWLKEKAEKTDSIETTALSLLLNEIT